MALIQRLIIALKTIWKEILNSYRSPIFLRILVIWIISIFILIADIGLKNYDYRFFFRSPQNFSKDVVILSISQAEWDEIFKPSLLKSMIYRQDPVTDSYYWNQYFWLQIFQNLKKMNVAKIGVDFYFSKNLNIPWNAYSLLSNNKSIFWISEVDNFGRLLPSKFSDSFNENIAVNLLRPDYDGILRNFYFSNTNIPQLPEALSSSWPKLKINETESLINFRGPPGTFTNYPLLSVFDGSLKKEALENKIIIIGPDYGKDHLIKTPLGVMNRSEIFATIIDNINENRWIKKLSIFVYSIALLPLIIICVWIILSFPQGIGITLLFSLSFIMVSLSILFFDIYYIWSPLITILSSIFLSYVIIISQMLFDRERNVWQMQKEQEYLKSLEELKTNFVSLISHDLKTPLAKIQSVINRVKSDQSLETPPQLSQELNSIYQESKHLDRYIKSILNLLKIESKDFIIVKKPIDVNEIIEKACEQLTPVASEKNIKFETNLEPMFLIEADKTLVLEIMINLIENAIKYSNSGSQIDIRSYESENYVTIEIQDQGPGIKEEHLGHIFEKFYRGENSASAQGSGLGLFLVKYFIELHSGFITLESVIGKGTKVIVKLPTEE
jgi:two-component system, OmpR family, phosphate regulon sensor histidine kinase PhoR